MSRHWLSSLKDLSCFRAVKLNQSINQSINRPISVSVVTIHCSCSSTWVVLDREIKDMSTCTCTCTGALGTWYKSAQLSRIFLITWIPVMVSESIRTIPKKKSNKIIASIPDLVIAAEVLFARATRSIAHLLLWQHGWMAELMSHAGIVSKRLSYLETFSTIIPVFLTPAPIPNSKRNPSREGAKYTGVAKFCNFRLKSPTISETVRDRPMITMKR